MCSGAYAYDVIDGQTCAWASFRIARVRDGRRGGVRAGTAAARIIVTRMRSTAHVDAIAHRRAGERAGARAHDAHTMSGARIGGTRGDSRRLSFPLTSSSSPNATTFSPERTRTNALFARDGADADEDDADDDDVFLDTIGASPTTTKGGGGLDDFEFERAKNRVVDWIALQAVDSRRIKATTDIDALESVLEHVVRCDIDAISNHDMCEPKRGRELAKVLQLLVEYLLHVQEALSEGKSRAEKEAQGWKDRARRERDDQRKYQRELRLMSETHEEELIAVAAEYAKKRNAPDSAELEDARRRGEAQAAERASRDLEKRLREQRELFDGAIDRMRAAHAEAQAEAARELAARKAELAAARAEYVSQSVEATKEANRMVADAQNVVRDAREKAELEKSNVSRVKAELSAVHDEAQRSKRALIESKSQVNKLNEDIKRERDAAAELRSALERRDEERRALHETLQAMSAKTSNQKTQETQEIVSLRELTKSNYAEIERLKRENEVLRRDKDAASKWVAEEKQNSWVSANEQILQEEITRKDAELKLKHAQISQLQAQLVASKTGRKVTFEREENVVKDEPKAARIPAQVEAQDENVVAVDAVAEDAKKKQRKTLEPPPREAFGVRDISSALAAVMNDLDVDVDAQGLDDEAFERAMKKFQATRLRDVPKELRSRYDSAMSSTQREIDGVVIGGKH